MDFVKPLFSLVDQSLLQQGLQKLMNECDDHIEALNKGMQLKMPDDQVQTLCDIYSKRKSQCQSLIAKLPLLQSSSPVNNTPAA